MNKLTLLFLLTAIGCREIEPPIDGSLTSFSTGARDGILPYYQGKDMNPVWPADVKTEKDIRGVRSFHLTDQNDSKRSEDFLRGKITAVAFFFSNCRGICPMITQNMKLLEKEFLRDDRVQMASISIDPSGETRKTLQDFIRKHEVRKKNWFFLRGDQKEINRIAREDFDADIKLDEKSDLRDFLHSEIVYLLDKDLRIRGFYRGRGTGSMERLIRDIRTLL